MPQPVDMQSRWYFKKDYPGGETANAILRDFFDRGFEIPESWTMVQVLDLVEHPEYARRYQNTGSQ